MLFENIDGDTHFIELSEVAQPQTFRYPEQASFQIHNIFIFNYFQTPDQTSPLKRNMKKYFFDDFLSTGLWQKF